jgi:hypothetical protein
VARPEDDPERPEPERTAREQEDEAHATYAPPPVTGPIGGSGGPGSGGLGRPAPDRSEPAAGVLPGSPLSALSFGCAEHDEEIAVDYYDPVDPPRCSHGDLMKRKRR